MVWCRSGEEEGATSEDDLRTLKNGEAGACYKSSYSWKTNVAGVIFIFPREKLLGSI
jgi:hypothetical protein